MSGEQELTGPDLVQGIALADLADGALLQGHAGGEPVLLARQGDEVFALGAHCTHYGGPLAEGIMAEATVRCPWHHACFDLRSGEAVGAPALNALQRYEVIREGDRVRVGGKLAPAPRPRRPGGPATIVIAGAGAAGNAAAEELRRQGYGGRIVLVGREDSVPYDRPNLSKDYLAGTAQEEWIPLHPPEFYAEQEIELRLESEIVGLDVDRRQLQLANGDALAFDGLLLALGAEPVRLKLPGAERLLYLRSLADSRAIIARAAKARRAVVLGASFIGLEVAASLRARGLEVVVVAPEAHPLERVLGPDLGAFIRGLHEEKGVEFRLGQTAASIGEGEVTLASGERLAADFAVAGVGVRPAVAIAERAGLRVDDNGIVVDEYLETSARGIYAAGDSAHYPDPRSGERIRVEHWVAAERQGQAAARNLLDLRRPFTDVPFFWSQHYDVVVSYVGHAKRWDRIDLAGSLAERNAIAAFRASGEIRAVATIFRDQDSLRAELAMERGDRAALEGLLAGASHPSG
jgi:NADPH-dependent 2,4-dienoyl-CoA reductase/sulfur reductase-like enzyme/nitrite reductase/ring-hydroxylating ferredoxin subunit